MIFFNTENKINFKLTFKNLKTVAIFLPILLLPYLIIKAPGIKNVYLHGFSMNICINIILLLGAGILEEALFRFYLLDIVRRFSPKIIAVIIIAVFYSVFHYSLSVDREWYVYIYFIIFSIILSVIRFDAKNLFFNGFIHFFVNLLFNYL
jgi:membrane protease YdiL (CAAX protease family)